MTTKGKRVNFERPRFIRRIENNKIGPLRELEVVWIGVRDWPVAGLKIQLLVAEGGWSETRLYSTLINRGCVDVVLVCCVSLSSDWVKVELVCSWCCCLFHHHPVVPLTRISLALSRHFSLSFITSGRSSGLHPVSSHSYCMYILAGRPAFAGEAGTSS